MKAWHVVGIIAIIMAGARFTIPVHPITPHGSYEAFAHLFVGGLIGAWLASWKHFYLFVALALSAVELVAFFTLK